MAARILVLFLFAGTMLAQNASVIITDSHGNQTTGSINDGNVYFNDDHGNSAYGTIRDGSVFVTSNKGETTFGTIRDGSVFLTDSKGNTTGTIRNGQIFLNNSDGSTTTGNYDNTGNAHTSTTPSRDDRQQYEQEQQQEEQQRQQAIERQREINQENYEAGAAIGGAIGTEIGAAIDNHRYKEFCKENPTSTFHRDDGTNIACPDSPLDNLQYYQHDSYCTNNPGGYELIGSEMRRVDCVTPPNPPNLVWSVAEMKAWAKDAMHPKSKTGSGLPEQKLRANWEWWRRTFCSLAGSGATYKDLKGKKQGCD
jgi:hypothetical protein